MYVLGSQPCLPVLPHGNSSTLSSLSETFSFHSSPESFITSRVLAFQASNPTLADSRTPIRANVLNRNVAVISSYKHVRQILHDEDKASSLSAGKAYDKLMAPFFPPPNLLLADPPAHRPMKDVWKTRMESLPAKVHPIVQKTAVEYFRGFRSGATIDLYESMKELSWRLILGIFTAASEEDAAEIEALQEDLLRGQFTLFPISINAKLWRSPRAKGKAARKRLQTLLKARVEDRAKACPFAANGDVEAEDVARHLLLFTSSLAVKSLASLLTAVLLDLFIYREAGRRDGDTHASNISLSNAVDRLELLKSMILETERLSPPVVGIMRRTTQDIILASGQEHTQDTLVPKDWDVWLYFVGAGRDPAVFGDTADLFRPGRYHDLKENVCGAEHGFAYGAGPKSCLGEDLMREVVMNVASTVLGLDSEKLEAKPSIELQGKRNDIPKGVQGWLGWQQNIKPEEWARDMKQLPTQRPLKAVMVKLVHNLGPDQGTIKSV